MYAYDYWQMYNYLDFKEIYLQVEIIGGYRRGRFEFW